MKNQTAASGAEILRNLPSIDAIIRTETAQKLLKETGAKRLTVLARAVADAIREELQAKISGGETLLATRKDLLKESEKKLLEMRRNEKNSSLQRVINATGVVVHTNLGRAPLAEHARRALLENASRYCNLEYDLETGKRGRRGRRAEQLLAEVSGAEATLIVNNCAAAAFLVLTVLAAGGEVVISRGELVEIGGDFRVPDVMAQSGAVLKEVGTTNRTKLKDYENAINENTRMILRVHPSNYRIVGFTSTPDLSEIAEIARKNNILLYEDAGSGAMFDLSEFGLKDEPVIPDSVKSGADVVTFSGDKLLGGVQSGLIVGKKEIIEKLRKHPLYRALRVDKLIYAALEATLESFYKETALNEIPVLKMLSAPLDELKNRTENFARKLRENLSENSALEFETIQGNSVIGGGSAPMVQPETVLLALKHKNLSAPKLEVSLRDMRPAVISRILDDKVLIDLRTVSETEETELLHLLNLIA